MRKRGAWSTPRAAVAVTAGLVLASASAIAPAAAGSTPDTRSPFVPGSVITEWMTIADVTTETEPDNRVPETQIVEAYVAAAMYNAVVGIEGRYAPYKWQVRGPGTASSPAAAVAAAHRVLHHYFPQARDSLRASYTASLAELPAGRARDEGVAFGKRAADHVIALRARDGRGAQVPFSRPATPGAWQPTPPRHTPFDTAWLGKLKPFALDSPRQFRPGPPPSLTSARYAKDYNEVKAYGVKTGSRRNARQTDTAHFFTELDITKALGDHASRHRFDITDTARLYAAANTAQADAVIAAWDAKLHYGSWRPVTAIRHQGDDGNPATTPAADWEPLLVTPSHPDYLSGHATTAGALSRALTRLLGSPLIDLNVRSHRTGKTRHYGHAWQYDKDAVDARVFAGIHTRTADTVGNATGHRVADWVLDRYFQPLR
ncbi:MULTISPECIES: vanadium-dependent haloperoxidase [Streptomyces]|uniref:Uncharacterized protein n=2 Tax=Streptomyces TaxID=1883 RepID=A0A117IXT5_9ACTN|nr:MULTISPECIES: vanadium-dependent haloperoxidase [Streptomyces]KUH40552.1 hypothetical protein ATE80_01290 [Streptomyces kanasensis]UUS33676.1 vanadium-dependent haloperoxidase [Streptomyces changanensis]